jgi:hypothetical protein
MKLLQVFALILPSFLTLANGQQSSSATTDSATAATPTRDRKRVDATLKRYEDAYQHMSLYELQNVWPDLPNQKKEYRKAEDLMKRGDVSKLQVSVDVQDVQVTGDDAVLRAVRHEQYQKNEKSSYYGGDTSMAKSGTQTPGPTLESENRTVKKTQAVTVHLHRKGDTWEISSIEEAGKHR